MAPAVRPALQQQLQLSEARASAMLTELLAGFSCGNFQLKLQKVMSGDGSDTQEQERWLLASRVYADIYARHGFRCQGLGGAEQLTWVTDEVLHAYPRLRGKVEEILKALCINQEPCSSARPQAASVPLSHSRALALQQELLAAFSSPDFQKKLNELCRQHDAAKGKSSAYRAAFKELVRSKQLDIIPRYGFQASEQGVEDMLAAFKAFEDAEDDDVCVNKAAIEETLFCASSSSSSKKDDDAGYRSSKPGQRPGSVTRVEELLLALLLRYSSPQFQNRIGHLKALQAMRSGRPLRVHVPDGYYRLPGRAALAFQVQKCILPIYGFAASPQGVIDMIAHCSQFMDSPRVARLMDETNAKLGMTPAACERFRKLAANLLPKKNHFASQHAARLGAPTFGPQ
eukprot:TRINITY_DN15418_c0_g1_i1.p1 TRINITY_DN15418_c0_g1~~TRINITY_DN15418_c0_g1_i1.p1  ORF type:complete len:416 (-),score=115.21 TRINITY_DN15418_c0_g1_i1:96-1295(-)